jgi:hypothetical protein
MASPIWLDVLADLPLPVRTSPGILPDAGPGFDALFNAARLPLTALGQGFLTGSDVPAQVEQNPEVEKVPPC